MWSSDETDHWKECQTVGCGNIIDKAAHSGGEATCTDGYTGDTYCKDCGEKLSTGKIIPAKHTLVKVEAKEATHEEDGNIEYYECSVCGKIFADAEATEKPTTEPVETEEPTTAPAETEPTETKPGKTLGEDDAADTGDNSLFVFWVGLLGVSAVGAAGLAGNYKKRKENE